MYRSVVLSLFIEVCNHNYNLILDYFITLNRSPVPISSHSELLPYLMLEATTDLLSVSDLSILDISCKWNNIVCGLLCLDSLSILFRAE